MIAAVANETSELKAAYDLRYVWLISIVAAMGGLLFGWDWVVIGGAKPFFQRYFELTSEAQIGWANSCALIGCLVGALVRRTERQIWPQAIVDRRRVAFRHDFTWQCAGERLQDLYCLADLRRRGHRVGIKSFANVHR